MRKGRRQTYPSSRKGRRQAYASTRKKASPGVRVVEKEGVAKKHNGGNAHGMLEEANVDKSVQK